MREILFRGKRRDNSEWVYGNFIDWGNHEQVYIFPLLDCASSLSLGESIQAIAKAIIPETVGQYTGLKDKNGNKIFEGDIIECVSWNEFFSKDGKPMEAFRRKLVIEFKDGKFISSYLVAT